MATFHVFDILKTIKKRVMVSLSFVYNNIDLYVDALKKAHDRHEFEYRIIRVYFIGGSLGVDINQNHNTTFVIMFNINTETFSVSELKPAPEIKVMKGLLSIRALKVLFEIYRTTKGQGQTDYYKHCLKTSCLRHLQND